MRSPRSRCKVVAALLGWHVLSSCGVSIHKTAFLVGGQSAQMRPVSGPEFTLLTWNVHKQTDSVFLTELADLLVSTRADIALLQEAAIDVDSTIFAKSIGRRQWALSANLFRSHPHREIGVATASSITMEEATALLSFDEEPVVGSRKPALCTRHRIAGTTISVINLHALNFSPSTSGFRRQLVEIAERFRGLDGPAVVAGDFNTWSRNRIRIADSVMSSAGFVRLDFGEGESRKTSAFGHPLDHIYYTAGSLSVDFSTLVVHTEIRSSDHFPLSARFRLTGSSFLEYFDPPECH